MKSQVGRAIERLCIYNAQSWFLRLHDCRAMKTWPVQFTSISRAVFLQFSPFSYHQLVLLSVNDNRIVLHDRRKLIKHISRLCREILFVISHLTSYKDPWQLTWVQHLSSSHRTPEKLASKMTLTRGLPKYFLIFVITLGNQGKSNHSFSYGRRSPLNAPLFAVVHDLKIEDLIEEEFQ